MESAAQAHLKIEAELGTIDTHGRGDKFTYGNTGGHRIIEKLDRFDALERNVELLLSSDAKKTEEIELLLSSDAKKTEEISSLKAQVGLLVQTSEGYLKVRRRFLEVYKRDIKNHDAPDLKKIRAGNVSAHEGDAVADAAIFEQDHRSDTTLYQELYGLKYGHVLELHKSMREDGGIIRAINSYATIVAQGRNISEELRAAFKIFTTQVEANWLQPADEDPTIPLGRAYFTFLQIYNSEISNSR